MLLAPRLAEYIRACFTGLCIESHEHQDALAEIAALCHDEDWRLAMWDIDGGLQIPGQAEHQEAGGTNALYRIRAINAVRTGRASGTQTPLAGGAHHSGGTIQIPGRVQAASWRRKDRSCRAARAVPVQRPHRTSR